ncbi:MAG: hypothetical protein WCS31_12150 [Verrucomicrobiae bacterium]
MELNALDKIKQIQNKADKDIGALKQEAVTALCKMISEAKDHLAKLQSECEQLTRKTFFGHKANLLIRRRLTNDEKASLVFKVAGIIKAATNGISMGKIVKESGESTSAVRDAISQVKGITKTGSKATTLYFLKR